MPNRRSAAFVMPRPDQNLSTEPALLSTRQLTEILCISRKTLHVWRALGRIGPRPVTGPGQHPKWDAAEVRAWLANRDDRGQLYDETTWPPVWLSARK